MRNPYEDIELFEDVANRIAHHPSIRERLDLEDRWRVAYWIELAMVAAYRAEKREDLPRLFQEWKSGLTRYEWIMERNERETEDIRSDVVMAMRENRKLGWLRWFTQAIARRPRARAA